MTQPRKIPNAAKWLIEDNYKRFLEIDRLLAPILGGQLTQSEIYRRVGQATRQAANGRAEVLSLHPKAKDKVR